MTASPVRRSPPSHEEMIEAVQDMISAIEYERDHLADFDATGLYLWRGILEQLESIRWRLISDDPPPEDTEVEIGLRDKTFVYIMNDHYSSEHQSWVDWECTMSSAPPTHWRVMSSPPSTTSEGSEGA